MYLTILFVSNPVLAANNRGEGEGNLQTLQKVNTPRGQRTMLSGYSIKRAIRHSMQCQGARMYRKVVEPTEDNPAGYTYGDNNSPTMADATPNTPQGYDDGAFGYMAAPKGTLAQASKIVGAVEVSPALSTTLYQHDTRFTQGLKAAEPHLSPFSSEIHYTRYQYTVTANIPDAKKKGFNFELFLKALLYLCVGGNHSSNASEVSPEVMAYRFHKAPGRGGLYLGAGIDFAPDEAVTLTPLQARCASLGINDYKVAGTGCDTNVPDALDDILAEIQKVLG